MALPLEVVNALRQHARFCRAEILERIEGVKSAAERDTITGQVLDKHTKQLRDIPSGTITPKSWLVYYVRLIGKE